MISTSAFLYSRISSSLWNEEILEPTDFDEYDEKRWAGPEFYDNLSQMEELVKTTWMEQRLKEMKDVNKLKNESCLIKFLILETKCILTYHFFKGQDSDLIPVLRIKKQPQAEHRFPFLWGQDSQTVILLSITSFSALILPVAAA